MKLKISSIWQPSKRSHNTGALYESSFKDSNEALCGFHLLTVTLLLVGLPAVCGLPLHYIGYKSMSKGWQVDTTISFEQQMPTFDIDWTSHLNSESKWAYLKFIQAVACCPLAIYQHLESTIKARRKNNGFFLCSPNTGHLRIEVKSRGGATKNRLYWANIDERCCAFSWVTSHQCKSSEPE